MKILFISQSDSDGGASLAAFKLAESLRLKGLDISMFVMQRNNDLNWVLGPKKLFPRFIVKIFGRLESVLNLIFTKKNSGYWSFNYIPNPLISHIDFNSYDIVHLHWIGKNTLSFDLLSKIESQIVWTLHDSWIFTGGCHLPSDCSKFRDGCNSCPQLKKSFHNIALFQFAKKKSLRDFKNITYIAPSSWMQSQADSSQLLNKSKIRLIHNGISIEKFYRVDTNQFKLNNNISKHEIIIVFGGYNALIDLNKGFDCLIDAIRINIEKSKSYKYTVLTFGTNKYKHHSELPFRLVNFKVVRSQLLLNEIYSSAHLTAIPSYIESFGQMAVESLSCGTPVVAFRTTGLIDIIEHMTTGYLANPFDVNDLANGIECIHSNIIDSDLTSKCRNVAVSKFSLDQIASDHIKLYNDLITIA